MTKRLIILAALFCACTTAIAQQRGKNSLDGVPWNERVFFGGGGGFRGGTDAMGNRYTYVALSPLVGYRITVPFSMGATINYIIVNYPDIKTKVTQYGVSPYAMYRIGKVFGYAEYSFISVPNFDNTYRATYTRFPVGLGFTQPIGNKAAINAIALYDIKYVRTTSVFTSPWIIRVFITAGGISM
jgi:hypothetical protein